MNEEKSRPAFEEKSRFGNDETFVKNPDMMMKIQFENMKKKFD